MFRCRHVSLIAVLAAACTANAAISFNLSDGAELAALQSSNPTLYAQVRNGFVAGAAMWSAQIASEMTVNITINYKALGSNILGQSSSESQDVTFASAKTALGTHATSTNDALAVSHLPTGSRLRFYTNHTTLNPSTRYLETSSATWTQHLDVSNANAKALGLLNPQATGTDGSITFASGFTWDFTHSASMSSSSMDFVGVAAHEIGHSLGFESGVDIVDYCSYSNGPLAGTDLATYRVFSVLDLYRHKAGDGGVLDLSTGSSPLDGSAPYLSLDGGVTSIGAMSSGDYNGTDSPTYQASHWQQSTGWLMKPAVAYGQLTDISSADLVAMDVIGYTLVPEPGIIILALAPSMLLLRRGRRTSRRDVDA